MGEINQLCLVCRCSNKHNENSKNNNRENGKNFREAFTFTGSNGNQCLNKQLWNIFIARRLLQLPQHLCREILQLANGRKNPSSWFTVCQICGDILEEAWRLHGNILELENKLKNVGNRFKNRIRETQRQRKLDGGGGDGGASKEEKGTSVEKRIWKWLLNEGKDQPSSSTTFVDIDLVKREISSPDRDEFNDSNPWDSCSEQIKNHDDESEWNPVEFLKRDDDEEEDNENVDVETKRLNDISPLIKTEIDEEINEPPSSKLSRGDSDSDSNLSFSDDEDVWEPKRKRKCRGRPPGKKKKKGETENEKGEEDKEEEALQDDNVGRLQGRKRSTLVKNSRSKYSVQKAKSSLRSKSYTTANSNTSSRKYARKARVSCSRCPAVFRGDAELAPHAKLHEKCDELGNEFDCKTCGYPSESERSLRQHMSLKHELQKYICDVCGYEAPRKGRLARHKKLHMNMVDAKTYQCDICQEKFNNYIGFTRHQRKEHAEELNINLFKCEKCPSAYTTNKMLQDHILHVHERNSKWCCDICGKGLLSEKNLKEHLETHEHRERSEICWVCGVDFLNNRSLREHVRKFHPNQHNTKYAKAQPQKEEPEKEYKCLYCTFTSPFRLVVMRHRKTHRDVFRHLCEICSNEYSSLASLVLHKKIAHGDGKTIVQCEWCQKSFAHKHYLQNHIPRCKMRPSDIVLPKTKKPFRDSLLVTTEGNDPAPLPPPSSFEENKKPAKISKSEELNLLSTAEDLTAAASTSSKRAIKTNNKTLALSANDPKTILCKYCKHYKTDNRGKMYDHVMKVHKDELEFKYSCDICDLKYTTKPSLNRHMAIHHSAENMMACTFCQKVFRHWSLLRLHYKHSCKSMPPGAPIPEAPNKRSGVETKEKKDKTSNNKPKISKFRVPRQRGKVIHGTAGGVGPSGLMTTEPTLKRKKSQRGADHHYHQVMYYHQQSGGQEDSMETGLESGGGVSASLFSEQQTSTSSTSTSPTSFPIMYPPQHSIAAVANTTGMQGMVDGGSVSAAAAAAMQMFSAYNNSQGTSGGGGGGSGTAGQRGWW